MLRLPRLTHLILCALLSAGLAAGCDKNNKPDDEAKGAETSDVEEQPDEEDGSAEPGEREFPQLAQIELPDGFEIEMFAPDVPNARSLELSQAGTLFVSNRTGDKVFALKDTDGDGRADERHTITSGRRMPNGVALRDGALYVAEVSRVLKFPNIEENLEDPPEPEVIRDDFPTDRHHGWKFIKFGPDGKLYVPVGAPCNICEVDYDKYGNIQRMDPDGSNLEVWAKGVRNTVGFDWHPETGELWFTDNGGDNLGDNRPPDELNHAPTQGMHFGYPYCHGGDLPDPKLGDKRDCSEFEPPAQKLGPHVAALGMEFYEGEMFPEKYHNQIFIAEHGSWNRTNKIGYRVMMVTLDDDGEATSYEPFAEGWLQGEENWGRPVDVEVMADGSLLVSDDQSGSVYRIVYRSE